MGLKIKITMKRALFIIALLYSSTLFAQNIGVRVGLNHSDIVYPSSDISSPSYGFSVGIQSETEFLRGWRYGAGFIINRFSYNQDVPIHINAISLPFTVSYLPAENIKFFAGPEFMYVFLISNIERKYDKAQLLGQTGFAYTNSHIEAGVKINLGLTEMFDEEVLGNGQIYVVFKI